MGRAKISMKYIKNKRFRKRTFKQIKDQIWKILSIRELGPLWWLEGLVKSYTLKNKYIWEIKC